MSRSYIKHGLITLERHQKHRRSGGPFDRRTKAAQRAIRIQRDLIADLGGPDNVSTAQTVLIELLKRDVAFLDESDRRIFKVIKEYPKLKNDPKRLAALYGYVRRLSGTSSRTCSRLGWKRNHHLQRRWTRYWQRTIARNEMNISTVMSERARRAKAAEKARDERSAARFWKRNKKEQCGATAGDDATACKMPQKSCVTSETKAEVAINLRSSILSSVHALEMPSSAETETVCASPVCDVRFKQGGIEASPKRFCSDTCKQQTSIIRRAAALLVGLGKEETWKVLRDSNE